MNGYLMATMVNGSDRPAALPSAARLLKFQPESAIQECESSPTTQFSRSPFCDSSVWSQHKAAVVKVQQLTAMPLRFAKYVPKKPAEVG